MKPIDQRKGEITPCDKCGWAEHGMFRPNECDPGAGRKAKALADALPDIPSTQLGYGMHRIAFEPTPGDDRFRVHFRVDRGAKPFQLATGAVSSVWLLDDLSQEAAADLVTTLAAWRRRWSP